MTTGPLNDPAIPVSPRGGPAVAERGIGPGGVSGCCGMTRSERVQPARQSSRIQGGQDTVERHGGLDDVMEKIDPWVLENPGPKGREPALSKWTPSNASCMTVSRPGLSLMRRFATLSLEIDTRSASISRSGSSPVFNAPFSSPPSESSWHRRRGYQGPPDAGLRGTAAVPTPAFAPFYRTITKFPP